MLRRGMILGSSFAKASPLMGTMSAPMLGVGDAGGRLLSAGSGVPGAPSPAGGVGHRRGARRPPVFKIEPPARLALLYPVHPVASRPVPRRRGNEVLSLETRCLSPLASTYSEDSVGPWGR